MSLRPSIPDRLALFAAATLIGLGALNAQTYPPPPIVKDGTAILLRDYASLPLSGRGGSITNFGPNVSLNDQLGRVNFLRSEPSAAPLASSRFFVNDLNRNLYLLNRSNQSFAVYLNFQSIFPGFDNDPGFAGGLVTFAFDPAYATNGIFYTVHTEDPSISGSAFPVNTNVPGFRTNGYALTTVINPPVGSVMREAVLVEWTDTNINNATFEGTARELLRLGFTSNIHPLGDLIFNPLAQPGDEDYRNLYLAVGDGGAGETTTNFSTHYVPQRLDALQGKILRITPDLSLRPGTSVVSANERYRIPSGGADPNPFVNTNGAFKEIFSYGHRNPHRFTWDPISGQLLVFEIGLSSFEEINVIHKGENYGYAEREGTRKLIPPGGNYSAAPPGYGLSPLPNPDLLPLRTNGSATSILVPVHYPVAEYFQTEGDAMSCGFVYRGALLPRLHGKCIFGDITTGRLFYADFAEMLAADDTNPATLAAVHEIQVVFNSPTNPPAQPPVRWRMFDVVAAEYARKGGNTGIGQPLPGRAAVTDGLDPDGVTYGRGRADIRLAMDADGELYVLSKSDGMIRQLAAVVGPPVVSATASNGSVILTWEAIAGQSYRVQYKSLLEETNWNDLAGDVLATNSAASKSEVLADEGRFYRVWVLP